MGQGHRDGQYCIFEEQHGTKKNTLVLLNVLLTLYSHPCKYHVRSKRFL